jgi:dCTP deaminase
LDESSFDLSLSDEAYRLINGSVKPVGNDPYEFYLGKGKLAEKLPIQEDGSFLLKEKQTYIFKLREKLQRNLAEMEVYGQATAKSSVGRVDVLTRLIVDGMETYECFTPEGLRRQSGEMYLEVTPITFPVRVRSGISLSQLRLFYGEPSRVEIRSDVLYRTIFHDSEKRDGSLTVDLQNSEIGGLSAAAFYAEPNAPVPPISLWAEGTGPDPCNYWNIIESAGDRLTIHSERFYILRSKEKISVPPGIAIYCRASDETIGEMRIHYAGFVHPWFGRRRGDGQVGTPLIFEVRGHQVNVSLADGERLANLTFYRMSEDASDEGTPTGYEKQTLQLSKFFASWPDKLERNSDGKLQTV